MPQFKVAHLREQGQDMIIVPLDSAFGSQSSAAQSSVIDELEMHAHSAGLAGTVVAVWDSGFGRMGFLAPRPWHPFFRSIGLRQIYASLNRVLSW